VKNRKNSAVETVPTPGIISRLNRYFPEIPILTWNKAASLEALRKSAKKGQAAAFLKKKRPAGDHCEARSHRVTFPAENGVVFSMKIRENYHRASRIRQGEAVFCRGMLLFFRGCRRTPARPLKSLQGPG